MAAAAKDTEEFTIDDLINKEETTNMIPLKSRKTSKIKRKYTKSKKKVKRTVTMADKFLQDFMNEDERVDNWFDTIAPEVEKKSIL